MNRRNFLNGSTALLAVLLAQGRSGVVHAQAAADAAAPPPPFSGEWVIEEARRLAAEPYQPPSTDLPDGLGEITYDQFKNIWFKPEQSLWANEPLPFRLDFLHLG